MHSGFNPRTRAKLRPQIDHTNLRSMSVFTPLAMTVFAILTVVSYFYDYKEVKRLFLPLLSELAGIACPGIFGGITLFARGSLADSVLNEAPEGVV